MGSKPGSPSASFISSTAFGKGPTSAAHSPPPRPAGATSSPMGWSSPSPRGLLGAPQLAWAVLLGFAKPRHVQIFNIWERQVWELGGQGAESGFFDFLGRVQPVI